MLCYHLDYEVTKFSCHALEQVVTEIIEVEFLPR